MTAPSINRRGFLVGGGLAMVLPSPSASTSAARIDQVLRAGLERCQVPAVVAMCADRSKTLYSGAFGKRDSSGVPVRVDSIFRIASMTKAVTTVAALQLVEQGKLTLDEPVSRFLPQLTNLEVLEKFDESGQPVLRPARVPVTLRHLLTHTSGFCYEAWDGMAFRYASLRPSKPDAKPGPLIFEPGTRWQYGQGLDWTGKLVEAISATTLEEYFQQKILRPLGMIDTSYIMSATKFDRLVSGWQRHSDGTWTPNERKLPQRPVTFNGGGGLFSTAADYTRFMQMILNRGEASDGTRILHAKTVESMMTNQIGESTAGKMKSYQTEASADVDIQPGHTEKWGLGFLINTEPYPGGRSMGSLAWAGLYNTFFWIDPKRRRCGVILMQFLPFVDKAAISMLDDFERAVYANL